LARLLKTLAVLLVLALACLAGWRWISRRAEPQSSGTRETPIARGGELIASVRSEPTTYSRYAPAGGRAATDLLTLLTHAPLVRINRASDELEPWLAESWTASDDGVTYTVRLREGVTFSDGQPFTSADVLFSFRAAYDPALKSALQSSLMVKGKPLAVSAHDARTVVIKFPERFAPGLRLLDMLPILPKHRLETALDAGRLAEEWVPSKPLTDIAGLGPFVLTEHIAGQRLVLTRNAHYFRRDPDGVQLPYLDKLTLSVVSDQNTEALRLQAGETDLMSNGEIRPQDYVGFKRLAGEGRLKLLDVGVGLDPDFLAFNLRPDRSADPRASWLQSRDFRQAISAGVDRRAIVNTVYLGAAEPIYGPVSPGNRTWHASGVSSPTYDPAKARRLLASAGLRDTNGDGQLEDAQGKPARFSILTQGGHNRERVASVIQEQLRQLGLTVDIVALDQGGLFQRWSAGDWDTMYFGLQASSTDPALNSELWLSSGAFHFWNPSQKAPATEWERRIDALMAEQATASDLPARQKAFAEVQRILSEEVPLVHFVALRVTLATSARVRNPAPALQLPQLLWSADTLAAAPRAPQP
jgi:peptide/nickel transport system substrate-binding protein